MPKLNVLITGSTGYIGVQLIKLLVKHKHINIKYLCGNSSVGKNINVAAIASDFGGGGHKNAAGFTLTQPVENFVSF